MTAGRSSYLVFVYIVLCGALLTGCKKDNPDGSVNGKTVTDFDGNIYHVIIIGKQTWMLENLRTSHYATGDPILVADNDCTSYSNAYAYGTYYEYGDSSYIKKFGRYYNAIAVLDNRGLAPRGWHVASAADWAELFSYLGDKHPNDPDSSAAVNLLSSDTSFYHYAPKPAPTWLSQLPDSSRQMIQFGGKLNCSHVNYALGVSAYFWTSTVNNFTSNKVILFDSYSHYPAVNVTAFASYAGMSVRCVKNN